jgi:hypothetical protein
MSGWALVVHWDGRPVAGEELDRVGHCMAPYGTDGTRAAVHGAAAAVVQWHAADPGAEDDVPIVDGDALLCGSLRLDDRDGLRRALRDAGVPVAGDATDARLALAAWRAWGADFAERLIGDFAIAIWDGARRTLLVARDGMGVRLAYHGSVAGTTTVSNAVAAIRTLPGLSPALDDGAIADFLAWGSAVASDATAFVAVRRVPRGTALTWRDGRIADTRRHWRWPEPEILPLRDAPDAIAAFRDAVDAAVGDRLRGRSASLLLSGGVDSALLAHRARVVRPDVDLRPLTLTHPDLGDPELAYARATAGALGLPLVERDVAITPPVRRAAEAIAATPLPVVEPDDGAWRETERTLRAHAPVVLDGEDGDALLFPSTGVEAFRELGVVGAFAAAVRYRRDTGVRPWLGVEWRRRLRALQGDADPAAGWLTARAHSARHRWPGGPPHPTRSGAVARLASPNMDALHEALDPATTGVRLTYAWPLFDRRVIAAAFSIPAIPWCQRKAVSRAILRPVLPPLVTEREKTPLYGLFDARVAAWRATGGSATGPSERVAPWVDIVRWRRVCDTAAANDVATAWRAYALGVWLDQWDLG